MIMVVGLLLCLLKYVKLLIVVLIVGVDGSFGVYVKQYLYVGEECYFLVGDGGFLLEIDGLLMVLVVCVDFS